MAGKQTFEIDSSNPVSVTADFCSTDDMSPQRTSVCSSNVYGTPCSDLLGSSAIPEQIHHQRLHFPTSQQNRSCNAKRNDSLETQTISIIRRDARTTLTPEQSYSFKRAKVEFDTEQCGFVKINGILLTISGNLTKAYERLTGASDEAHGSFKNMSTRKKQEVGIRPSTMSSKKCASMSRSKVKHRSGSISYTISKFMSTDVKSGKKKVNLERQTSELELSSMGSDRSSQTNTTIDSYASSVSNKLSPLWKEIANIQFRDIQESRSLFEMIVPSSTKPKDTNKMTERKSIIYVDLTSEDEADKASTVDSFVSQSILKKRKSLASDREKQKKANKKIVFIMESDGILHIPNEGIRRYSAPDSRINSIYETKRNDTPEERRPKTDHNRLPSTFEARTIKDRPPVVSKDRRSNVSDDRRATTSRDRRSHISDDRRSNISDDDRRSNISDDDRRSNISDDDRRSHISDDRRSHISDDRRSNISDDDRQSHISDDRRSNISYDRRSNISEDRRSHISDDRRSNISDDRRSNISDDRRSNTSEFKGHTKTTNRRAAIASKLKIPFTQVSPTHTLTRQKPDAIAKTSLMSENNNDTDDNLEQTKKKKKIMDKKNINNNKEERAQFMCCDVPQTMQHRGNPSLGDCTSSISITRIRETINNNYIVDSFSRKNRPTEVFESLWSTRPTRSFYPIASGERLSTDILLLLCELKQIRLQIENLRRENDCLRRDIQLFQTTNWQTAHQQTKNSLPVTVLRDCTLTLVYAIAAGFLGMTLGKLII